jgi:lipopolysaccharide export system protein LptA
VAVIGLGLVTITLGTAGVWAQAPRPAPGPPAREGGSQPVTVDADRMERYGKESLVIFTGNVEARQDDSVQYADRMEV